MVKSFVYTYPNISPFKQRGGLKQRYDKLMEINSKFNTDDFRVIEIPADFIKRCSEENRTGLNIGSFLNGKTVPNLYTKDKLDREINYILHTEPVFNRKGCNKSFTTDLKWYDRNWIKSFILHTTSIIDFFETSPYGIEIHPGRSERKKNTIRKISEAIEILYYQLKGRYQRRILIFIENRTEQIIKSGKDIRYFWKFFSNNYPNLTEDVGVILDIQQLYTVTKENFVDEFLQIPENSISGLHIHTKHQPPSKDDIIPWNLISREIKSMDKERTLHILPEVFHSDQVELTYKFCKDIMKF